MGLVTFKNLSAEAKIKALENIRENRLWKLFLIREFSRMAEDIFAKEGFEEGGINLFHRDSNRKINDEPRISWTFDLRFDNYDDLINLFNKVYESCSDKREKINVDNIQFVEIFVCNKEINVDIMPWRNESVYFDEIKEDEMKHDIAVFFDEFRNKFELSATNKSKEMKSDIFIKQFIDNHKFIFLSNGEIDESCQYKNLAEICVALGGL